MGEDTPRWDESLTGDEYAATGWTYLGKEGTSGGVCRIWERELPDSCEADRLHVEYDIKKANGPYGGPTATEVYDMDGDHGKHGHSDANPMLKKADTQTDQEFAEAARELMRELNENYVF